MEDKNKGKSRPQKGGEKVRLDERNSEATSDETLSDLEETEDSTSTDTDLDPGPSPDGALDQPDEVKDAGPM